MFLFLFLGSVGLIILSLFLNKMLIHRLKKRKEKKRKKACYTKSKYVAFSQWLIDPKNKQTKKKNKTKEHERGFNFQLDKVDISMVTTRDIIHLKLVAV